MTNFASANVLSDAPAGTYAMDKTHGYVTFTYSHMGYSNPYLRFRNVEATIELDSTNIGKSVVKVTIDPASIDSGVDIFDEHLRDKPEFFDVKKHPTIMFTSTSVILNDDNTLQLTGDLIMKGISKPITLNGTLNKSGVHPIKKVYAMGFSVRGTIKRSEWDLGQYVPMVGDNVEVIIEAEFMK